MATSKEEIEGWVKRPSTSGQKDDGRKVTHVMIVCDSYDYTDYPVYVHEDEDIKERIAEHSMNMQRVVEVYKMSMDIDKQLREFRARNL